MVTTSPTPARALLTQRVTASLDLSTSSDGTAWPQGIPQEVQGSNFPDEYADHQSDAERIIAALIGVDVVGAHTSSAADTCSSTTVANGDVEAVIGRGKSIIGTA
ncbi:hypothetical protein ACT3UL_02505 [Brachybacterium sp. 107]